VKKESSLSKLFAYAGKFRYLTIASWILSFKRIWLGSRWICHFIHAGLCVRADVFPSGSIPRPGKYPHQPDAAYPDTANGIFR